MDSNVLGFLMTMEYVRVRKSTLNDIKALIKKREPGDWHILAAIVGMVLIVAVTGLVLAL